MKTLAPCVVRRHWLSLFALAWMVVLAPGARGQQTGGAAATTTPSSTQTQPAQSPATAAAPIKSYDAPATTTGGTAQTSAPSTPTATPASPGAAPATSPATGPAPATARKLKASLEVSGSQAWTDTGLEVKPGDQISISGEAAQASDGVTTCDPEGAARGWRDLMLSYPLNSAGRGALLARIGSDDAATPFLAGKKLQQTMGQSGRLFLGLNQPADTPSACVLRAKIAIVPGAKKAAAPAMARLDSSFFQQVPRRNADPDNRPGDMVNFIIVGPEAGVQQVFQSAGWVAVDKSKEAATLHALMDTLGKGSYTAMPMSELYLFGRAQDYGFAHAEPLKVVATRHHLRVWRAPFSAGNREVWVGAATHDIGFEKDQRNGGVTHKIDPDIDTERQFVADSLNGTGLVGDLYYLTPSNPVKEAKTATGGSFHSDGRVLVLVLQ